MNGPSELLSLIDQRIRASGASSRAWATCNSRDITGPGAYVTFDGSTTPVPVKVQGHVELRPGMRCTLDRYGSEWMVTGAYAVPQMGYASVFHEGNVTTTTSASYVGYGSSASWTFEKFHDESVIEFTMAASAYPGATAAARGRWAIRLVQTDGATPFTSSDVEGPEVRYDLINVRVYSSHRFITPGPVAAPGGVGNATVDVPAGVYTCAWRWKRTSGTGTLTTDTTDIFSCVMEERVISASPYV